MMDPFSSLSLSGSPAHLAGALYQEESFNDVEEETKEKEPLRPAQTSTTTSADQETGTSPRQQRPRIRAWKNILGVAFAMSSFTLSLISLQGLQSSINSSGGLGLITLSVLYGCLIVSCIYSPALVRLLGSRKTLLAGYTIFTCYTLANVYPRWYTLIPTAAVLGLMYGPVWASVNVHMTTVAIRYAPVLKKNAEDLVALSAGILFLIIGMMGLVGMLVTSTVLFRNNNSTLLENKTAWVLISPDNATQCTSTSAAELPTASLYILIAFYIVFNVVSIVLTVLFVDNLDSSRRPPLSDVCTVYLKKPFLNVVLTLFTLKMLFLVPMLLYSGIQVGFFFGRLLKNIVSDCLGVSWIGYVGAVYSASTAMSSILSGCSVRYIPRLVTVTVGIVIQAGIVCFLLLWTRSPSYIASFGMCGAWGIGNGISNTQTTGIIGAMFPACQDAAFSILRMWVSAGYMWGFLSTHILSLQEQLWLVLGSAVLTLVTYTLLVIYLRHVQRTDCHVFHLSCKRKVAIVPSEDEENTEKKNLLDESQRSLARSYFGSSMSISTSIVT